jgi:hypothetical protein
MAKIYWLLHHVQKLNAFDSNNQYKTYLIIMRIKLILKMHKFPNVYDVFNKSLILMIVIIGASMSETHTNGFCYVCRCMYTTIVTSSHSWNS